ncbi:MAG: membrane-bound O-acyltransferase family protein [Bacteroidetes bacterium 4484_276]|nr:MAG: membrane-bound O-acyltransferase family protein [Bacteroidetes bacterium 4484_276]
MVFSTLLFLFLFLPAVLLGNFILPFRFRNYFLLFSSFVFFAWGGVSYSILLVFSVLINYSVGLLIHKYRGGNGAKIALGTGVGLNLLIIIIFKYSNFIFDNINILISDFGYGPISISRILLPIGISFYTFQAISYLIDLYRKQVGVQKDLSALALYIFLFPQLIAGPIIRYHDISNQIKERENNLENFVVGIRRFILGLAKKVLIANQMAVMADQAFGLQAENLSTVMAWIGIIAYSFQIYFDFSGYSDMAIGLGRMLGFKFPENFNFPYIARSIKEFWRRWHISLSTWFRDYLYIPLGGNRKGTGRTYVNLLIVFFLTGLWHGASWNFVIWGFFHGTFLVLERIGLEKLLLKLWKPFQHIYTLFVVLIAWVFFRADTLESSLGYLKAMFVYKPVAINLDLISEYDNILFYAIGVAAILSSSTIWVDAQKFLSGAREKFSSPVNTLYLNISFLFQLLSIIIVLALTTFFLVSNSYNPFIYFRF